MRGRDGGVDLLARRAIGVADHRSGELVDDREGLRRRRPTRRRSAGARVAGLSLVAGEWLTGIVLK